MSRPSRLPDKVYAEVVAEIEARFHKFGYKHVPGDRSVTHLNSMQRNRSTGLLRPTAESMAITMQEAVEFEKETGKPAGQMMRLEVDEDACRKLIARAENNADKNADTDLLSLMIYFFDSLLNGNSFLAPEMLVRYVRGRLMRTLPKHKSQLHVEQLDIALAVNAVLERLPGIKATRNPASQDSKHPESACSLVAKALTNSGHAMSEHNVRVAWDAWK